MAAALALEERRPYSSRHRLTVEQFHRMGDAGVIHARARVELFEGELLDLPPIGPLHAGSVDHVTALFAPLAGRYVLRVQSPLVVGDASELLPDLMLLRPREGGYTAQHPKPEDVVLLLEIADSSLRYDREDKLPLYGRSGVAESWLLDLTERRVQIFTAPGPNGYRQILRPEPAEIISPTHVPDFRIPASGLFAA